jgi:hypothetical protein
MADVVVCFAQRDRRLALTLCDHLESQGWTVWWDRSLDPSHPPANETARQIAAARAVVAIWTETSARSQRVLAEARAAEKENKLVSAKAADFQQGDIPLPFRERHAVDVADGRAIKSAVAAQMVRAIAEPVELERAPEATRNAALKWLGIAAGSLTLFGHAGPALGLTFWAHQVAEHWIRVVHAVWAFPLSLLKVQIPLAVSLTGTLVVSLLLIAMGERWRSGLAPALSLPQEKTDVLASRIRHRYLKGNESKARQLEKSAKGRLNDKQWALAVPLIPPLVIFGAILLWPIHDAIISMFSSSGGLAAKFFFMKYLVFLVPLGLLYIAPLRPVIQRLWLVITGCAVLAGLNEVWKLTNGEGSALLRLLDSGI